MLAPSPSDRQTVGRTFLMLVSLVTRLMKGGRAYDPAPGVICDSSRGTSVLGANWAAGSDNWRAVGTCLPQPPDEASCNETTPPRGRLRTSSEACNGRKYCGSAWSRLDSRDSWWNYCGSKHLAR
jgi:hypothetical protein